MKHRAKRAFGLVVTLMLGGTCAGWAQGPAAESAAAPAAKKVSALTPTPEKAPRAAAKPQSGPHEGIKVHGRWVIEIRNPDGTLATRREFNNHLAGVGGENLAALLARNASGGRWLISLSPAAGVGGPCPGFLGSPTITSCAIQESGASAFPLGAGVSTNLAVSLAGVAQNQVVLNGSAKALGAGRIDFVATQQGVCPANVTPQNCTTASSPGFFSVTGLNTPVTVQQGQTIDVTVTFSFS